MGQPKTEESIQNWLKRAKQDLHFLSVHLEEHAQGALKAKLAGNQKDADYWASILERSYKRIKELREVIAQEESELSKLKRNRKPCECGCGQYPKSENSRFLPGHDLKEAYRGSAVKKGTLTR